MKNKITLDELQKYLWGSAVLLRTHVDAGSYKQYIFPLLFFKRLSDVYDEESEKVVSKFGEEALAWEEIHQFNIPEGAHWNDVRNVSENVGKAIVEAFHKIESANPDKLQGIFGDASWTNKNRLPDRLLKDLMEHFSKVTLTIENCPADELGQGYEYLVRKFADDSGHTAQEFYTNRSVVELMTEILKPKSGESIYDPTCGSAGMLISSVVYLKQQDKEWRNLSIYGQEIVTLTSTIARMNLILHGVQDFDIVNADTLKTPAFTQGGKLKQFDLILANPPYSIKKWDRAAFEKDKYGRNILGVPPQGRADYAFFQHILTSMNPVTGRCAILFPHGVLSRNDELDMRKILVQLDLIDTVIGIGKGLFYNSPMEACIVICRSKKPRNRKNRILFINAKNEVTRVNAHSYLESKHIERIANAYELFAIEEGFSAIASLEEIAKNNYSLGIPKYVSGLLQESEEELILDEVIDNWIRTSNSAETELRLLSELLGGDNNA